MPMIRVPMDDPALFYIQGEQMRAEAFIDPVLSVAFPAPMLAGSLDAANAPIVPVLGGNNDVTLIGMIPDGIMNLPQLDKNATGKQIRANACIATHFGTFVDFGRGLPIINTLPTHTGRWSITGQTKDSAGAALGNCRVIAFETGRMGVDGVEATVGETISDGSGNYTISASLNVHHQLTAYKPGSPDVAGITRNDVTPIAAG
jgi:hypothetical protein